MNAFCERLALAYTFIQAPMAGVSTPALALAVSEAGALGSLATGATLAAAAQQAGEPGFAVQWAGTGAGQARALAAAELVRTLAAELQTALAATPG